jgi:hypothetical protein
VRRRSLAVALAVSLAAAGGSHALAAPGNSDPAVDGEAAEHHDAGSLEGAGLDVVQGVEAVEQLEQTDTLDEVAAAAGLEPQELKDELLEDSSMFVTDSGFVGYADTVHVHEHEHEQLEAEAEASRSASALTAEALPANVFALESRPTSTRVLYLDFNGHTANDPVWGGAGYSSQIVSAPFDADGISGFSLAEQATIFEVWQRVAEDYRPFDVNVTTRDPGIEGLRRTSIADTAYGQRMVITPSNFTNQSGVIGIALLDVFGAGADHAAYVFTDAAFKRTPKTIGEAVSHEAGHTFGLSHDGGPENPQYYDGHGSWAPIMGRPISPTTPVTQWSRGEYASATNFEDDLAMIAARAGYRPDDHANSATGATVVKSTSLTVGNIERTDDRDVFAVDVADGTLAVQLRPPEGEAAWSNLAAALTVRSASGEVVATGAPTAASGWTVDVNPTVPAGRYTIEVRPVGWLTASTGFTTYGSLGAYELVVEASQGVPPAGAGASALTPVRPLRVVDTRNGIGAPGRLAAGRQVVLKVADGIVVPADATAVVVSVAAVNPSAAGFVTVYPCSDSVPDTSTLNYVAGQTVANTTIAAVSGAGQLCVWTFADSDILVDVTGWLGPRGTSRLTPIGPRRVVDTRAGLGGVRLGAGATIAVDAKGFVPAGTTAVALNVTAVGASAPGFITVFPCSASGAVPNTSTINYVAGEARPNNTIVGLGGGRVCIYSSAATEVLVDLLGAYGPSGLGYQATPPVRVLDTRRSVTPGPGAAVSYGVGAPALGGQTPGAAYVNITATDHTAAGFVTTYDCIARRDTSTLNQQVGQAAANGAIVPLDALRSCAWTSGGGDLIVDLNGWWVP